MDEKRSDSERIAQIERDLAKAMAILEGIAKSNTLIAQDMRRQGYVGLPTQP